MTTIRARLPPATTVMGRSCSVRLVATPCLPARSEARLSLKEAMMVGRVLIRVMKPPAATAPAPIWRT